jgi:DMSO reductase anchor subunit
MTSTKTQHISITIISRVSAVYEMIAIYSKKHTETINTVYAQTAALITVTACGTALHFEDASETTARRQYMCMCKS